MQNTFSASSAIIRNDTKKVVNIVVNKNRYKTVVLNCKDLEYFVDMKRNVFIVNSSETVDEHNVYKINIIELDVNKAYKEKVEHLIKSDKPIVPR